MGWTKFGLNFGLELGLKVSSSALILGSGRAKALSEPSSKEKWALFLGSNLA